jgi:hypothetical protein
VEQGWACRSHADCRVRIRLSSSCRVALAQRSSPQPERVPELAGDSRSVPEDSLPPLVFRIR